MSYTGTSCRDGGSRGGDEGEVGAAPMKKLLARLFVIELVLLAGFGALELGSRLWLDEGASEVLFRRFASQAQLQERYADPTDKRFVPHRYIGYRPTPNYKARREKGGGITSHNALGYRGADFPLEKPPGEFRIVCLGGSTTYTTSVGNDHEAYPQMVEKFLRAGGDDHVRVINAGSPAWSTYESMINFQFRVLELDPDLIVVYHAVNDIHTRVVWPTTAYRGDNSGRRQAVVGGTSTPAPWEYSTFLRILAVSAEWATPASYVSPERILFTEGPATFHAHEFFHQWAAKRYPSGLFTKVPVQRMLDAHPPIYYERNLETIIALARAHGVGVMMATFATSPEFPESARASSPEYQGAYPQMNAVMKRVCARNDVPCYDFAADFPRTKEYFDDGRHVNKKGAQLKARLFARFIVENDLVGDAP